MTGRIQSDGSFRLPAAEVPEKVARLAYAEYARRYGKSQSFERLMERGGFGWFEFASLLLGANENEDPYDWITR